MAKKTLSFFYDIQILIISIIESDFAFKDAGYLRKAGKNNEDISINIP